MPIKVAVPKETQAGEQRVALVPDTVGRLVKKGFEILVEKGAGQASSYFDEVYQEAGAVIVDDVATLCTQADLILKVQPPNEDEIAHFQKDVCLISFMNGYRNPLLVAGLRDKGVTSFAMELVPRISRAQSMDALSSQATVAGYKAALMAANLSNRFFPMLTTAAGTIRPAKVLVLGAGVAGLQAIATTRRLGAIVEAYDVRRAAGEQVESLGAKFLQIEMDDAESAGGYARELTDEEKQREQAMLWRSVGNADVIITTAQIPGRDAPCLLGAKMVDEMKPGAVVIDLAAETGGNCELTVPGEEIVHKGVIISGPLNVPSQLAYHASEMYAKNIMNLVNLLCEDGEILALNWDDEIFSSSVVTHEGAIKHEPTKAIVEGGQS